MAKTRLLTLLGRANKQHGDYRKAVYALDGKQMKSSYFGRVLAEYCQCDELIVLGTRGSMWENLFLQLFEHHDVEPELLGLIDMLDEQCRANSADQSLINTLAERASTVLGFSVCADLISYADAFEKQINLIEQITAYFEEGDAAILDITHGLRHLPLLVQQVAQLLPVLKRVEVKAIYYGALDMTDRETGLTPVMKLDGLARIDEWQQSFVLFERTGNAGVFVPLLKQNEVDDTIIEHLRQAAFYEQTNRTSDARRHIDAFKHQIEQAPALPAAFRLFLPRVLERMDWAENNRVKSRQLLAEAALDEGDYLRATIFAYEASVLHLKDVFAIDSGGFVEQNEGLNNQVENAPRAIRDAFHRLRQLRNAIAHGNDSSHHVKSFLRDEHSLKVALSKSLTTLMAYAR